MLWYFSILWLNFGAVIAPRPNEYLTTYEPIFYSYITLRERHETEFYFQAFHQDFHIVLHMGSRTLDSRAKLTTFGMITTTTLSILDISRHLVMGYVREFDNSSVSGYVFDGVFVGVIRTSEENYQVDRASDFITSEVEFESIIYRYSDINVSAAMCLPSKKCRPFRFESSSPAQNFSLPWQKRSVNVTGQFSSSGLKICTLRVMVDHVYYQKRSTNTFASVIANFVLIIDQVDKIYRSSDFDGDGSPDGIGFKIVEFIIWWNKNLPGYKHDAEELSSSDYLQLLTHYKTDDVCLFLGFTARSFGVVLGRAYVRVSDKTGICASPFPKIGRSYNVAKITAYRRDQRLPNIAVAIIVAHEVGHAFGSDHDPLTEECLRSPGGDYIMADTSPDVLVPNSNSFSPCSLRQINSKNIKLGTTCFVEEKSFSACGNGIVDSPSEECDCGDSQSCSDLDSCCTHSSSVGSACKYNRRFAAQCSYRQDKCCNSNCKIISGKEKIRCNSEDECKEPSFCNGINKDCPVSRNKPDGSHCRNGIGVCIKGKCVAKTCHDKGETECMPLRFKYSCTVHCFTNGWCKRSKDTTGTEVKLPDGLSCSDGNGQCSEGKCVVSVGGTVPVPGANTESPDDDKSRIDYIVLLKIICIIITIIIIAAVCTAYILYQFLSYDDESDSESDSESGSVSETVPKNIPIKPVNA